MSEVEAGSRYPFKAGPFSSHARVLQTLGSGHGRRALDVGCAQGEISITLMNLGWEVVGIEPFKPDADLARARGVNVIEGFVEESLAELKDPFDAIVAADVLEHLADPTPVLRHLGSLLTPNGIIVVSLPNVAHLSVRLQLLLGRFDYQPHGIMDGSHLRFFTRRTAIAMLREAGLEVASVDLTPVPLERLHPAFGSNPLYAPVHRINHTLTGLWPRGLAYQFILVAQRPSVA